MKLSFFFPFAIGLVILAMIPTGISGLSVETFKDINLKKHYKNLKTQVNSALDTINITKLSRSIDKQAKVVSDQMGKFSTMLESLFLRMDQLEKQMVKVEEMVKAQENKTFTVTQFVEKPPVSNCTNDPEPDSYVSSYQVREPLTEEDRSDVMAKAQQTVAQITRIEDVVYRLENSIHEMRIDTGANWRLHCVDKKYLDMVHNETNKICREQQQQQQQKPVIRTRSVRIPRPKSASNSAVSQLIDSRLQALSGMMQNVSSAVNNVHYEVTEGKLWNVSMAVDSVRELYDGLQYQLKERNENAQIAFKDFLLRHNEGMYYKVAKGKKAGTGEGATAEGDEYEDEDDAEGDNENK